MIVKSQEAYDNGPQKRQPVRYFLGRLSLHDDNSSSNFFASFRSSVSNPSVNQP